MNIKERMIFLRENMGQPEKNVMDKRNLLVRVCENGEIKEQ